MIVIKQIKLINGFIVDDGESARLTINISIPKLTESWEAKQAGYRPATPPLPPAIRRRRLPRRAAPPALCREFAPKKRPTPATILEPSSAVAAVNEVSRNGGQL